MPGERIPSAQEALDEYEGFDDADREKIAWRNAFTLFPGLSKKFPHLK